MTTGAAAVILEGVSKRYGKVEAVTDVSITVNAGEYVTLLGPSGSGKSTLLRLIAGLESADTGEISIRGKPATTTPPYRRNLGVVFQGYALFPHLSAQDNAAYPLRMRGMGGAEARERANAILARVGLSGLEHRRPSALSGGQQQRVALARALAHDPPLLLLDEPLSALDRGLRESMRGELRRIQRDFNVAVLHVTHDQEEALSLSDRIVLMEGGKVVQSGPPDQLYERPATPFVAKFLGGYVIAGHATDTMGHTDQVTFVDSAGQHFQALAPQHAQPSQAGALVLRREWMQIVDPRTPGHRAVVISTTYLGACREIVVRLASGGDIAVQVSPRDQGSRLKEGDAVMLAQTQPAWFVPDA